MRVAASRPICADDNYVLGAPRERLADDYLAWLVADAVEVMDLSAFYGAYRGDGWGRAALEPKVMVALLLYPLREWAKAYEHRWRASS